MTTNTYILCTYVQLWSTDPTHPIEFGQWTGDNESKMGDSEGDLLHSVKEPVHRELPAVVHLEIKQNRNKFCRLGT